MFLSLHPQQNLVDTWSFCSSLWSLLVIVVLYCTGPEGAAYMHVQAKTYEISCGPKWQKAKVAGYSNSISSGFLAFQQ